MKHNGSYLRQYLRWLGLLLGVDALAALLLWLADARAFAATAGVIVLTTVFLFACVCAALCAQAKKREQAFSAFLRTPDAAHEQALCRLLAPREAQSVHLLGGTLRAQQQTIAQLQAQMDDYEHYVELWAHEVKTPLALLTLVQQFLAAAAQAGNLVDKSEQVQDVTTQYMDIEARLSNLTAQRTRLQELQASAENLSDLLEIESSLSDVQYQIESWQSQLDWYSQQVSCSTVYLSLDEVKEYTPTEESYLSQLSSALRNGWTGFVSGIQQLTVWVVGVWPVLVVLAAAALVVRFVRRRTRK